MCAGVHHVRALACGGCRSEVNTELHFVCDSGRSTLQETALYTLCIGLKMEGFSPEDGDSMFLRNVGIYIRILPSRKMPRVLGGWTDLPQIVWTSWQSEKIPSGSPCS
jgi:hypothetical protein